MLTGLHLPRAVAAAAAVLTLVVPADAALLQESSAAADTAKPVTDTDDESSDILRLPENFVDTRAGVVVIEPIIGDGPLPNAGYEKSPVNGLFIQSSDGEFRLQIGGYTQIRWNLNDRDAPDGPDAEFGDADTTTGWSLNRTRFFVEGRYTEYFSFHFRTNTSGSTDTELLIAWGQYKINDRWSVRFGKQFIPLSREDWMFAQDLLTIEFSPNDFTYAIGQSLGAFLSYQGDGHRFWLAGHNGAYGGREDFPSPESDVAATARLEVSLAGDDWTVWDDVVGRPGRAHGVMLGLSGAYQTSTQAVANGHRNGSQLNADLSFNGDGYQAMLATSGTWLDLENQPSFANYGALAQMGYFLTDRDQIYAQYNWLGPGDRPGDFEDFHSIALGYSYFPFAWTNRWKFSAELGHLFSALNNTVVDASGALGLFPSDEGGQTYIKLQAQIGF